MNPSIACARHRALAGWRCSVCNKLLCPDCVAEKRVYPITLTSCMECGQMAKPLTMRFRDSQPLVERLAGAASFPLHGEGALLLAANSVGLAIASILPGEVVLGCIGLIISSYFGVIRATGRGQEMMEGAEFTDIFGSIIKPLLSFALATVWFWLVPLAFYLRDDSVSLPVLVTCAALGMLWTPVAILAAATNSGVLVMINPVAIVGLTLRLGKDALVYLGSWLALAVLMLPAVGLALVILAMPLPLVPRVLAAALVLYPLLVGVRISGLVLRLYGDVLGHSATDEVEGPVLAGVAPRGVLPEDHHVMEVVAEGEAPKRSFAPIELDEPAPPTQAELPQIEPITRRTELDVSNMRSMDETLLETVREGMQRNDVPSAVEALKGFTQFPTHALSTRELLWLGRAAASIDEDRVAHDALLGAAESTGHEIDVSKARVLLAKLLHERLGQKDAAQAWMERIVREHADSEPAKFAAEWLKRNAATQALALKPSE